MMADREVAHRVEDLGDDVRTEFGVILVHLAETMGQPITAGRMETYWRRLGSYPLDVVRQAAIRTVDTREKFPTIVELRATLDSILRSRRLAEQAAAMRANREADAEARENEPPEAPAVRAVLMALTVAAAGRSIDGWLETTQLSVDIPVRDLAIEAMGLARMDPDKRDGESADDYVQRVQAETAAAQQHARALVASWLQAQDTAEAPA